MKQDYSLLYPKRFCLLLRDSKDSVIVYTEYINFHRANTQYATKVIGFLIGSDTSDEQRIGRYPN